jgi:hypothetical protein
MPRISIPRRRSPSAPRFSPAKPVIVEAAISNADRVNIEVGFMKPDEKRGSYKDLFTNEFVQ